MNAFYKLACALVAWSALSLSAGAETMQPLSALPASAYNMSEEHPGRFGFVRPDMDLSHYHGVLLEPLSFLTQSENGDWLLLRALPDNPLDRHFRQAMIQALHAHGLTVAEAPAPDVMRLQLALALDARKQPVETALNLATLGDSMAHYLRRVQAVGQVVDSQSNLVLAGSAELLTTTRPAPADREEMLGMLDSFSLASADRIALILGHG
ncbi:DUF3313 family protein [Paludibacterium purpuratum]|uniref:Uncharacterized protein DUF3313 n=1 Tax=Paludibacterium purpuratum TaxID=1144873 RepID=A0A4R7B973_9NEIS|nr:DUF3313 family protein [Paludibacterium purpuratum]TDR81414.1 uncharacterized protein DUF3313 [Paludibacterium purpuratum]